MLPKSIDIQNYNYNLPEERIALFPREPRDSSKLLKYVDGVISHHNFHEIHEQIPHKSLLVFNQTRVIQARIFLTKDTGANIELLLLDPVEPFREVILSMGEKGSVVWQCMVGNKKRWKEIDVFVKNGVEFSWVNRDENLVKITWYDGRVFAEILADLGQMPIPPYINRDATEKDKVVYQTIYAQNDGSVAAPTAGLHFTDHVMQNLQRQGVNSEFITLHVGAGTFKPVSVDNALEHEMHAEKMYFSKGNILNLLNHQGPIIPVGTTSMRSLESLFWFGVGLIQNRLSVFTIPQYFAYEQECNISMKDSLEAVLEYMQKNELTSLHGQTSIFIVPGYQFRVCQGIITNFHQPNSTLLLLIAALIGENWRTVYQEALLHNYRFLSFGDSSLLLP